MLSRIFVLSAFFLVSTMAQGATISLSPTSQSVVLGNQVSFDLNMDFSDDPTVGGGLDVLYDGTRLDFVSFVFDATFLTITDPSISCPGGVGCPTMDQTNVVTNISFGDFGGIGGPFLVGTLTFDTLITGLATLTPVDTSGPSGPFNSNATLLPQTVTYLTADVNVTAAAVPLPGTFWLMVSGILGFVPALRRRRLQSV